ncbi:MAG TPA: NADH-quinone oxidoreductase subunit N [Dehalococcoidia bacterium]|jgi:NADH-quinone oxidoreductase subunit N|nr:NADH-quinone oxidoreductase subunit N [Dehalococcoidia bacterium]
MSDVNRLGPELALLIAAGLIVVVDALLPLLGREVWAKRRIFSVLLALAGVAGSFAWAGALIAAEEKGTAFHDMIVVDDFSLFFNFLFAGVAGMIVLGSIDFLERNRFQAEYLALVLTAAAGMMLMAAGQDLIMIFVALETQALAFYVLVGFLKDSRSSEAALKYLLLGAISTALTLYGMAYLFGISGQTQLSGIAQFVSSADNGSRSALVLAAAFLAAGLGFKMAVVPFQMWVPDVYEGAPTPVTAYLSVASKAAGFAVVMRVFLVALGHGLISSDWANMFAAIAAISMTLGNVMALVQTNVKRMLGYSSIAQAGTFLIGLAAVAAKDPQLELGSAAVVFFLGTYAFTNLGAFIAIIAISNKIESEEIVDFTGLYRRSPYLALGLAACLISLTGIPPTAGFIAKVYVFNAAVQANLVWLALIGVINSVISAYYYLRVVMNMFTGEPSSEATFQPSMYLGAAMGIAVVGLFAIGVYPNPLIQASEHAARIFA